MFFEVYVPIGCVLIILLVLALDEYLYRRRTTKGSTTQGGVPSARKENDDT
jgi:hypothetical protein